MIRHTPSFSRRTHSFPTRRSSDLYLASGFSQHASSALIALFLILQTSTSLFFPVVMRTLRAGVDELELCVVQPVLLAIDGLHGVGRSEEHTSELQSLMRNSYAVFCLKKKNR